jgi:hypothetical protein
MKLKKEVVLYNDLPSIKFSYPQPITSLQYYTSISTFEVGQIRVIII